MNLVRKSFFVFILVALLSGAAFSFAEAWNAAPQNDLLAFAPGTQGAGDCYANSGGGGPADDKDEDGDDGWSISAPSGNVITSACIKTGRGGDEPSYFQTSSNGIISVDGEACYQVSGIGTGTVTVINLTEDSACQAVSHIEARWLQPTATNTNTPTNTSTGTATSTDTPTETSTSTATNTSTNTPTSTFTSTPTLTATTTPGVSLTDPCSADCESGEIISQIINSGGVDITEDISWAFYFNGSETPFATGLHPGGLLAGQSVQITATSQGDGLYTVRAWIGTDTTGEPDSETTCSQVCEITDTPTNTPTDIPTETPTGTLTETATSTSTETPTETSTSTETPTPTETLTSTQTQTATNTGTTTNTPTSTSTATRTPTRTPTRTSTFTPTSTIFIPVTGGLSLIDPCTNNPGVSLNWRVVNTNSLNVSILWWVVGGTASGGPIVVPANSTVNFDTPIDGPLPNRVAIMWVDPFDGVTRSISALNAGEACSGAGGSPTPTATLSSLIPVTGGVLNGFFGQNMLWNLLIGIFGAALILVGIGIKLDRDRKASRR